MVQVIRRCDTPRMVQDGCFFGGATVCRQLHLRHHGLQNGEHSRRAKQLLGGWLLIPISALADVIRSDCKDGYKKLKQFNYYFIAAANVVLWAVTIPAWTLFFLYAQNLGNADEIFAIVIKLTPFYIAYAGCAIIDNIFICLGKTSYNAINSLIIDLGYYGVFYILYRTNAITFGMDTIILMFDLGMVVHYVISLIQEKVIFRRKELKISIDKS